MVSPRSSSRAETVGMSISTSRLVTLPPELRLTIYEYYFATYSFENPDHLRVTDTDITSRSTKQDSKSFKLQPPPLLTWPLVRREALPIYKSYLHKRRQEIKTERYVYLASLKQPQINIWIIPCPYIHYYSQREEANARYNRQDYAYLRELGQVVKAMKADTD